jgi:hypothetical protein
MKVKKLLEQLVKKVIKEESQKEKFKRLYTLAKGTQGGKYLDEYEKLYDELIKIWPDSEYDLALNHFKTANDFANYYTVSREKGEYLYPREKAFKSKAELDDLYAYRKGKR